MNPSCQCPRIKCERHGNCIDCQTFHSDTEKVVNFCKWAEMTGFSEKESRSGLKAWLSNDRTPFDINKWIKKKSQWGMIMGYKSIIFDFDGTLANSANVVSDILDKLIEKYNFTKVTPKELKHRKAASLFKKTQMMGFMLKIQNEFKQMYWENISKIQWYNDMPEILQRLRDGGYQLAILSSNSSENIKDFLKINTVDFPYPVLSSKGFFGKHKTINEYITELQLSASDVLYIGDEIRRYKGM